MDIKTLVKTFQPTKELSNETTQCTANPSNANWVWERMAGIWGEQWIREQGERPSIDWITSLSQITDRHIKRGVERTISERLEWTPSLPKFLSLCLDFDTEDAYNRMINRKPALNDVEYFTKQEVGYQCKRVLKDKESRLLFNKVFKKKLELKRAGKLPVRGQKSLPVEFAITEIDKKISARGTGQSDIEKRMAKIINNRAH